MTVPRALLAAALCVLTLANASGRTLTLLSGPDWRFLGAGEGATLPEVNSAAFAQAAWTPVAVPHNFQTRAAYDTLTKGWYRRQVTVEAAAQGKELYLVFEGAASVADVYVNGQHLGQHRGAYTRFVFDATAALHAGQDNQVAILVDDSTASARDCLPVPGPGLYKVWGGLYRKVWLLETAPLHIDPTDDGAPGVYLTPRQVSASSAQLNVKALLRNAATADARAEVRATVLDPKGVQVCTLTAAASLTANQRSAVELDATIPQPQLWSPRQGGVYHVQTGVYVAGQLVDEVTQPVGFRWLTFDWKQGKATVNGQPTILAGVNIHQETEEKGSALADEDLTRNLDLAWDLGSNFVRLAHYPRAQAEYDYCDQLGLLCWAENGNSTGRWDQTRDIASATSAQIAREMVKQNYNHPAIALWSVGNEAVAEVADQAVPIVKALDSTRPVVVANMQSKLADFNAANAYPGWYGGDLRSFNPHGFFSEIGAGGVVTTHCDYNQCDWRVNTYEPEEYQQLVAENDFQKAFHGDNSQLGLFCWWTLREFSDAKYKQPVGINSKGLLTYAGDKKDVYYLYRSFLRKDAPTLWITSKRYFLRQGAADNGIKVYGNARQVTLTLNGTKLSTLPNGQYTIPDGPWAHHNKKTPDTFGSVQVDNVFYWPVPLRTGKNTVSVTDDQGQSDSAVLYYEGAPGSTPSPDPSAPIKDLVSTNTRNPACYMDEPIHAQWPLYSDLDATADNSWNRIPPVLEHATWIALRRVSKPGQNTQLSFTITRLSKVYVMTTRTSSPPALPANFAEVPLPACPWRDDHLQLVPTQLFMHTAGSGEKIDLTLADRDAIVLFR